MLPEPRVPPLHYCFGQISQNSHYKVVLVHLVPILPLIVNQVYCVLVPHAEVLY